MGMSPTIDDGRRTNETVGANSRSVGPVSAAQPPFAAGLAALLGSEDSLFRDPFADFAPSGR
jgi:hypothetical protein